MKKIITYLIGAIFLISCETGKLDIEGEIITFEQTETTYENPSFLYFTCKAKATISTTDNVTDWGIYQINDNGEILKCVQKVNTSSEKEFSFMVRVSKKEMHEEYKDINLGVYALTDNLIYPEFYCDPKPFTVHFDMPEPPTAGEWIDLGLSVKWASCNVGADNPEEYGWYYAWGETEEKDVYSFENYQHGYINSEGKRKFTDIGKDIGGTEYDAATAELGDGARMPTEKELHELVSSCRWKSVTYKDVNGMLVTGPSGNSIFLPFCGYYNSLQDYFAGEDMFGFYWSSNNGGAEERAIAIEFSWGDSQISMSYFPRTEGYTIRPVHK